MRDRRNLATGAVVLGLAMLLTAAAPVAAEISDRGDLERPLDPRQVAELASEIDALVQQGLSDSNVRPNPPMNEDQFVRRAYLDIVGRIPSYEEVTEYRRRSGRLQRAMLIDKLLESEGYVSHSFNYWADLLRVRSNLNNASGQPYINFVKDSLRENKTYDQFVYDLLTAQGRLDENGAVGYFIRDDGMPLDNTANTVRIFLGTSIGCAQCHDHPFDKWSQLEFFEMASYTFGVRTREGLPNLEQAYREAQRDEDTDRSVRETLRRLRDQYSYRVRDTDSQAQLPHDYKYADAQPGETIEPYTIFGDVAEAGEGQRLREAYARWMTSKDNPRFAQVIANRLWKRAFGVGLIEPVDNIQDSTEAFNQPLMEYLTQLMIDLDYDMREFQRVVYNTRSYQREASRQEWEPGEEYHFPGPLLRRMTAEQVWDSFVTLAIGPAVDERDESADYADSGSGSTDADLDIASMSVREIRELAERIAGGDMDMMMMMGRGGGGRGMFTRASDLPQPAPPGHFLWRFGQSDRELIDNFSKDPSTTQVLTLLNGPIDGVLLRDRSYLTEQVLQARSNTDKLEAIWYSILGRRPTTAERRLATNEISDSGDEAFDNLVWALLNTREFLFIQ